MNQFVLSYSHYVHMSGNMLYARLFLALSISKVLHCLATDEQFYVYGVVIWSQ